MKYALLAILVALAPAFSAPAFADEDERMALARQVIATRSDEAEMQFFEATLPYYLSSIEQTVNMTDVERDGLPALLREEYVAALGPAREHAAATYARIFSEEELRELVAFYHSGVGRKFLERQTEIQQDGINLQRVMNAAVLQNALERMLRARTAEHF
jgi:hypothetical protein